MSFLYPHQYIDRETSEVRTEPLYADKFIKFIYSDTREKIPFLYRAVTSSVSSSLLGYINFDMPFGSYITGGNDFVEKMGIDISECVEPIEFYNTTRKFFERQIKFWDRRPMENNNSAVVSPADSKLLVGSFKDTSSLFIKEKFFEYEEFIGKDKTEWLEAFSDGDFAVCRLTPEKYHYNHVPVAGKVVDFYEIDGGYNSCNPGAVVSAITPYSKNKRVVTVIDTDIEGGTNIGFVIMVEVVALMIGEIHQYYCKTRYNHPSPVIKGMFLKKGQPKSLYKPGSSVDILIFQKDKIRFCKDILDNLNRQDAQGRFSKGFGKSLIETDLKVRSTIAYSKKDKSYKED